MRVHRHPGRKVLATGIGAERGGACGFCLVARRELVRRCQTCVQSREVCLHGCPDAPRRRASALPRSLTGHSGGRRTIATDSQLSDEHKMLRDMCRTFADTELAPNAGKWDQAHAFPVQCKHINAWRARAHTHTHAHTHTRARARALSRSRSLRRLALNNHVRPDGCREANERDGTYGRCSAH